MYYNSFGSHKCLMYRTCTNHKIINQKINNNVSLEKYITRLPNVFLYNLYQPSSCSSY